MKQFSPPRGLASPKSQVPNYSIHRLEPKHGLGCFEGKVTGEINRRFVLGCPLLGRGCRFGASGLLSPPLHFCDGRGEKGGVILRIYLSRRCVKAMVLMYIRSWEQDSLWTCLALSTVTIAILQLSSFTQHLTTSCSPDETETSHSSSLSHHTMTLKRVTSSQCSLDVTRTGHPSHVQPHGMSPSCNVVVSQQAGT